MIFFFNFLKENKMTSLSIENKESDKYTTLVEQLCRDYLNKTVEHGFIIISSTKLRHFKGVKNVEIDTKLYHTGHCEKCDSCGNFKVITTIRNDYILNDLFQDTTYLKKSGKNLLTIEVIQEVSNIIIKQIHSLNNLKPHRIQHNTTELFQPFNSDKYDKSYLMEDLQDVEFENGDCCICYKRTSTKMECCKAHVCKVCLIEIAHTKLPKKLDLELVSEEHKAINKLVCPHCRKDHNDYRVNDLLWAIQDEKFEEDEDEDEDEDDE
jgi:hypothetical protein